jgi:hypothetical protein
MTFQCLLNPNKTSVTVWKNGNAIATIYHTNLGYGDLIAEGDQLTTPSYVAIIREVLGGFNVMWDDELLESTQYPTFVHNTYSQSVPMPKWWEIVAHTMAGDYWVTPQFGEKPDTANTAIEADVKTCVSKTNVGRDGGFTWTVRDHRLYRVHKDGAESERACAVFIGGEWRFNLEDIDPYFSIVPRL